MIKRKIILVCAFCVFILLSGCGKEKTKELVLSTYEEWCKMFIDVWATGPQISDESRNEEFNIVEDENIHTLADIKARTEEICTKEGAQQIIYDFYLDEERLYFENDQKGILYRRNVAVVCCLSGELLDFTVVEQKKNYIHAQVKYQDDLNDYNFTIDLELVKEENKWLIDHWKKIYDPQVQMHP